MPFVDPPTPPSVATTGYLSYLQIDPTNSSPPNWLTVAEIKSFDIMKIEVPVVDKTTLTSPNGTEESMPGISKSPTVDLSGNWTGVATQLDMIALAQNRETFPWRTLAPVQQGALTDINQGFGFFTSLKTGPYENNKALEFQAKIQGTMWLNETVA